MLAWYDSLAGVPVDDVDVTGVASVDEFIDRLRAAGHLAACSSGTSGKCSFVNYTHTDSDNWRDAVHHAAGWPNPPARDNSRRMYWLAPKGGPMRGIEAFGHYASAFAKPEEIVHLTDEAVQISQIMAAAEMRKAMQDGTATPGSIAAFRDAAAKREAAAATRFEEIVEDIAGHHAEPLLLTGLWAQQWAIVEALRAKGIEPGSFHPETLVAAGGGKKGNEAMPDDFEAQIFAFFGPVRRTNGYSMTEMSGSHSGCTSDRYHLLPWILVLPLDEPGERIVAAESGIVEARYAFLDTSIEGRWGGLITGDRVFVDHDDCTCGRPGPTITRDIARYGELGEDGDKISCAGTFDAYVRGIVGS